MKKIVIIALVAAVAVGFGVKYAFFRGGTFEQERDERDVLLLALLDANADYARVTNAFRVPLIDCSVGSQDRWRVESLLAEPTNSRPDFRRSVAKNPKIYYHGTEHTMTWLFFDAHGVLQNAYVCRR